jgi:hypothetical protein
MSYCSIILKPYCSIISKSYGMCPHDTPKEVELYFKKEEMRSSQRKGARISDDSSEVDAPKIHENEQADHPRNF